MEYFSVDVKAMIESESAISATCNFGEEIHGGGVLVDHWYLKDIMGCSSAKDQTRKEYNYGKVYQGLEHVESKPKGSRGI